MAEIHSMPSHITAYDIVSSRIAEAKAICTIMAMSTSPDADPPAPELLSLALDGLTTLLNEAAEFMPDIKLTGVKQAG